MARARSLLNGVLQPDIRYTLVGSFRRLHTGLWSCYARLSKCGMLAKQDPDLIDEFGVIIRRTAGVG